MLSLALKLEYYGLSDIGLVREHNEDAWQAHPEKGLFLLADGMGGHQAGEVAATMSLEKIEEYFPSKIIHPIEVIKQVIQKTNAYVYQQAKNNELLSGMGTTLCCLFFIEEEAIYAHVGDSRIYRFRDDQLELLTADHSLFNELLTSHALTIEEAESYPYKHVLTKAIGTHPNVEPTIHSSYLLSGDLYLICSDGLTNFVLNEEIQEILSQSKALKEAGNMLVDLAKKHGGGDNATVILIRVLENAREDLS